MSELIRYDLSRAATKQTGLLTQKQGAQAIKV